MKIAYSSNAYYCWEASMLIFILSLTDSSMVSLIQSFYSFLFSVLILPLDGISVYKTTVAPSLFLRAVCLHQQAAHVTKF